MKDTKKAPFGLYVIVLLLAMTTIMGGAFYYSLTQRHQFQAEAGPLIRKRFLQTLIAREGQQIWRIGDQTLPLNDETWDFHVKGRMLEIGVRTPIPVENQASLTSEIITTARLLLQLEPANNKVEVIYRDNPSHQ